MRYMRYIAFLAAFALLPLAAVSLGVPADQANAKPQIEYPQTADFVVLEVHGKGGRRAVRMEDFLAGRLDDDQPTYQIFGDGRMLMRNDGKLHTITLSDGELRGMIEKLVSFGLHELDTQRVSASKSADDKARFQAEGRVSMSIDVPTYTLRFKLSGFAPEPGRVLQPVDAEVTWHSVTMAAHRYPDNAEIQRLARFERWLGKLTSKILSRPRAAK